MHAGFFIPGRPDDDAVIFGGDFINAYVHAVDVFFQLVGTPVKSADILFQFTDGRLIIGAHDIVVASLRIRGIRDCDVARAFDMAVAVGFPGFSERLDTLDVLAVGGFRLLLSSHR